MRIAANIFENDLLAVIRKARDVTERLFYGRS